MEKRCLNITLNDNNYHYLGSINDDVITYYESGNLITKVTFNIKNKVLTRDNIDYLITYDFNNDIGKMLIKELNNNLDINIKTHYLLIDKNIIKIIYEVLDSNDIFTYEIKY